MTASRINPGFAAAALLALLLGYGAAEFGPKLLLLAVATPCALLLMARPQWCFWLLVASIPVTVEYEGGESTDGTRQNAAAIQTGGRRDIKTAPFLNRRRRASLFRLPMRIRGTSDSHSSPAPGKSRDAGTIPSRVDRR